MSEEKKSFQRDGQSPTAIELVQDAIDNGDLGVGDLRVTTPPQSNACAEAAMPGTASIPPLFTLVPPPVDRDLRFSADDGLRDYGPDPIAEYALAMPARAVFPVAPLSAAITPELRRYFSSPTFYVRTPSGQVTYMVSADGPKQATEIIAGWSLAAEGKYPVQNVHPWRSRAREMARRAPRRNCSGRAGPHADCSPVSGSTSHRRNNAERRVYRGIVEIAGRQV
jgi:hypothetical protein